MNTTMNFRNNHLFLITAGSTYLDIDAYACAVAMAELLNLQGNAAIAYSTAPCNYSVCEFLTEDGQIVRQLPEGISEQDAKYIIVDVSDPEFLGSSVPLDRVTEVYDHHVGFEDYWTSRIGNGAHIEFIGAAATLIYREWKRAGLQDKMKRSTARLLIAAILDNTLNLTSSNTTAKDREVFRALCVHAGVGEEFRASYFSEVQKSVEADLKNALFGDIKTVRDNPILPPRVAQLCVWNAESVLGRLSEIRVWFAPLCEPWMINIIDLSGNCCYFVCEDENYGEKIARVFDVRFELGVAKTKEPYLRKQIIKKTVSWV
jgi:inorganic pyrophosphatase/exopolyphosphatase